MESVPTKARTALEQHLDFARKLHIEARLLEGEDEAQALVDFARRNAVTQIFVAKPPRPRFSFLSTRQLAMRVVRLARNMQVTVVADRRSPP
jgi:two-component system sensor histidine kinase KdpD